MHPKISLLLFCVAYSLSMACHKSPVSSGSTKIVHITDSSFNKNRPSSGQRTEVNVNYNADGSIKNFQFYRLPPSANIDSVVFNYFPSGVTRTRFMNGIAYSPDTFILNSAGNIVTMRWWDGFNARVEQIPYSGNEILFDPTFGSRLYTWYGGNAITVTDTQYHPNGTINNVFYSDKEYVPGDYIYLQEFLQYGRPLTHNRNLIASAFYVAPIDKVVHSFLYTFDTKNRITSCTHTESTSDNYERFWIMYED